MTAKPRLVTAVFVFIVSEIRAVTNRGFEIITMSNAPANSLSLAHRWLIILMLMGYAGIAHFNRVSISVAGAEVFIQDATDDKAVESPKASAKNHTFLHVFTSTTMGWVYTAFLVVYTTSMLPGGWVIDRIGSGKAMTFLGLAMGTFVALTGTLGWIMSTPDQLWIGLIVIRGLAGMCSAPLHPGAAHVVSDVASISGRTTANGLVTAGALLGIAFSYPVFGQLMDHLTWQWAFVVCGLIMVGYGVLWSRLAAPKLPGPHASRLDVEQAAEGAAGVPWRVVMRKDLWLVTLSYFSYSYYQYLFFYWIGYYFEKVLHVPNEQARQAAFFIALAQGAGMAVGGMSNDLVCRVLGIARGRRAIMLTGMSLCAVLTMIAVNIKVHMIAGEDGAASTANLNDFFRVVWFIALALAGEGMCEALYWTAATEIGGKYRGFACGFLNTGGNIGGFISPVLTPMIAEHPRIGWTGAIGLACAFVALGGILWLWIEPAAERPPAAA